MKKYLYLEQLNKITKIIGDPSLQFKLRPWHAMTIGIFVLIVTAVVIISFSLFSVTAHKYEATVVDAVTGQPIEGVLVIKHWQKYRGGIAGGYVIGNEEIMEGVSDKNGKIYFPGWGPRITRVSSSSPHIYFYKSGYWVVSKYNRRYNDRNYISADSHTMRIEMKPYLGTSTQYVEDVLSKLGSSLRTVNSSLLSVNHGDECNWRFIPIAHAIWNIEHRKYYNIKLNIQKIIKRFEESQCGSSVELRRHLLIQKSRFDEAYPMAEKGYESGMDADYILHEAVKKSDIKTIKSLLSSGADISRRAGIQEQPIHVAIKHSSLDVMKLLIKHGANVNEIDGYGRTPIHLAMSRKDIRFTKFLIEHGVNDKIIDFLGNTPLMYATFFQNRYAVDILLERAKNQYDYIDHRNRIGETALLIAAGKEDPVIIKMLLKHNADINIIMNHTHEPVTSVMGIVGDRMISHINLDSYQDLMPGISQRVTTKYDPQSPRIRISGFATTVINKDGSTRSVSGSIERSDEDKPNKFTYVNDTVVSRAERDGSTPVYKILCKIKRRCN